MSSLLTACEVLLLQLVQHYLSLHFEKAYNRFLCEMANFRLLDLVVKKSIFDCTMALVLVNNVRRYTIILKVHVNMIHFQEIANNYIYLIAS